MIRAVFPSWRAIKLTNTHKDHMHDQASQRVPPTTTHIGLNIQVCACGQERLDDGITTVGCGINESSGSILVKNHQVVRNENINSS